MELDIKAPKKLVPSGINLALGLVFLGVNGFQFILLPAFLLEHHPAWALLLIPAALMNFPMWSLAHEAFHGVFHPLVMVNNGWGRLMAIAWGAPFYVLQFGHLNHHRYNRFILDRPDVYDPASESRWRCNLGYFAKLLGGLYLGELLLTLVFLLPKNTLLRLADRVFRQHRHLREVEQMVATLKRVLIPRRHRMVRLDALAALALLGLSAWLYRDWPGLLFFILAARALIISLTDNVFHYGTSIHSGRYAKNLALPAMLSRFMLNFNLHHNHHLQPALPWQALPAVEPGTARPQQPYMKAMTEQFRGVIPLERVSQPVMH